MEVRRPKWFWEIAPCLRNRRQGGELRGRKAVALHHLLELLRRSLVDPAHKMGGMCIQIVAGTFVEHERLITGNAKGRLGLIRFRFLPLGQVDVSLLYHVQAAISIA